MLSEFSSDYAPLSIGKHQSRSKSVLCTLILLDNLPSPEPSSAYTPPQIDGNCPKSIFVPRDGKPLYIGRSKIQSDFVLSRNNQFASRVHAKVQFNLESEQVQIQCLGSNGLFVRWPAVFRPTFLEKGQCCTLFRASSGIDAFVSVEIAGEVFSISNASQPPPKKKLTRDLVVSALVFSRKSSSPLHEFYAIAMDMLPAPSPPISIDEFREFVHSVPFIGRIERAGKDAQGKALPDEYYYEIENDDNQDRRCSVEGSRTSLRSCRKKHKQASLSTN